MKERERKMEICTSLDFITKITKLKKEKIMEEKEALILVDEFPGWVSKLLQESASGARETIRWFIRTLYEKGYKIKKV